MTENPWGRLPAGPPYVLPGDKERVGEFNEKVGSGSNLFLHINDILPEPFVGAKGAPVVLLSNNPGFREEGVPYKQDPVYIARMRNNLLHVNSEYPFIYLAPDFRGPGKQWWVSKLKDLLCRFGTEVVARSIFEVVYFPYPSRRFGHRRLSLQSQEYSFCLVQDAVGRGAVIVLMRGVKRWLEAVPELKEYDHLCRLRNVQQPAISERNCPEFQKVVQAIKVAEVKRQKS